MQQLIKGNNTNTRNDIIIYLFIYDFLHHKYIPCISIINVYFTEATTLSERLDLEEDVRDFINSNIETENIRELLRLVHLFTRPIGSP